MRINLVEKIELNEYIEEYLEADKRPTIWIDSVGPLNSAGSGTLCFTKTGNIPNEFGAVFAPLSTGLTSADHRIISVAGPRREFAKILRRLLATNKVEVPKIPHSIAKSASIHSTATIEMPVQIGKNTAIHQGVVVHANSIIGDDVIVRTGAVIGAEGFGFERDEFGVPFSFPHFGGVVISDRVEVGNYSVISRGVFENTLVGSDTKLNSYVFVGHNAIVGSKVYLMVRSTITGGSVIEDSAIIGPGAIVIKKSTIGIGASVGTMSLVNRNVPPNMTVIGAPAQPLIKKS